jgi:chemotaxis protein methyltransferase CheR
MAGRYRRLEVNRGLPARMLLKHMTRYGEEWRVSPQLRSLCHFRQLNLCDPLTKLPVFDLVLLRNVLLYFSHQDRANLFTAVHDRMAEDSVLVLGNAEQAEEATDLFEVKFSEESFFYRPAGKKTMLGEGD